PAGDPIVTVLVAPAAVAGEIHALVGREIGLHEAVVVAIDGAHHPRPGVEDDEIARRSSFEDGALVIDDRRPAAEERVGRRAGLEPGCAGKRRDEDAAGLRLPPGIDDRTAMIAD